MPKKLRPAGDNWPLKLRTLKVNLDADTLEILICDSSRKQTPSLEVLEKDPQEWF
jgi:hypothetical protein